VGGWDIFRRVVSIAGIYDLASDLTSHLSLSL